MRQLTLSGLLVSVVSSHGGNTDTNAVIWIIAFRIDGDMSTLVPLSASGVCYQGVLVEHAPRE